MTADYRIGKSGWLMLDPVIRGIVMRVHYATGLNMRYSEPFQVRTLLGFCLVRTQ